MVCVRIRIKIRLDGEKNAIQFIWSTLAQCNMRNWIQHFFVKVNFCYVCSIPTRIALTVIYFENELCLRITANWSNIVDSVMFRRQSMRISVYSLSLSHFFVITIWFNIKCFEFRHFFHFGFVSVGNTYALSFVPFMFFSRFCFIEPFDFLTIGFSIFAAVDICPQ